MGAGSVARLAGKRVLVTGAGRGIGRAVARRLAQDGARIALAGRDRVMLEAAREAGDGEVVVAADLRDLAQVPSVADAAAAALGGLDVLVNNAGVAEYAPVGEVSQESLERQLAVNFSAPFLLAQRAAEHMKRAGGGVIVNVASTLALEPAPLTAAYGASKAALVAMTRAFALELAPHRIRVCAVAPGVVDTEMVRVERPAAGGARPRRVEDELEALRAQHPLGRLGRPEDVAEAVRYLLGADFATGTVLVVDGGLSLGQPR